ncbi:Uncharacterised protein [Mycobacterium tuberculosis]|nr:Uncharacterised protein [Mycobacterium tuberculosis]CRD58890.1 Uncharacterised protein [Mycobacterium tuberculosis]
MDESLRGPHRLQAGGQVGCPFAFVWAVGRRPPLFGDLVIHRHERRFAADGQPDVGGGQPLIDALAHLTDGLPGLVGVGQRDTWVFVYAGDGVGELQHGVAHVGAAADGCRAGGVGRSRQRNVALAGQQPRRRVQPDPAGTRDVCLGPRVQVGEVGGGPRRPVERFDVGCQLNQVAGHEPGGQPELTQDRDQQPRRVPARADAGAQREIRCLNSGLHAHAVADVGVDRAVECDQEVDGAGAIGHREVAHPGLRELAGARTVAVFVDRPQVRPQVIGERLGVGHPCAGPYLGPVLDKEVEGVDHLEVGDKPDGNTQLAHGIRKDQPRQKVAQRVLLPVDEVVGGLDAQRVGFDGGAGVRRRA